MSLSFVSMSVPFLGWDPGNLRSWFATDTDPTLEQLQKPS
jgi:hypothetical protein